MFNIKLYSTPNRHLLSACARAIGCVSPGPKVNFISSSVVTERHSRFPARKFVLYNCVYYESLIDWSNTKVYEYGDAWE